MHKISLILFFISISSFSQLTVRDDFEGNGTITSWKQDNTSINEAFANPFKQSINTSNTVLRYIDNGGQYANTYFDVNGKFDLSENYTFSLKIYVPASGVTGSQNNQVSLKLQNNNINAPWTTQTEIIKNITLNQWQTITFDFKNDTFININAGSLNPIERSDLNRVLIQINGENNTDRVTAYIDDFLYDGTVTENNNNNNNSGTEPVYNNLVWSDEFDGAGAVDGSKWFHQTQLPQGKNWYNGELQHYTDRIENTYLENGNLHIVAIKESFTDQNVTKQYTSARLNSKYAFTYGKVQVRAKLPTGAGTWPAIWMLGKNITEPGGYWTSFPETITGEKAGWPACGEIDIMEHWGKNQNYVSSAMHTPSSYGGTINHGGQTIPTVSTAFHVYELIWTPEKMVFSVDGNEHYTYNPAVKDDATWPFDTDQYFLLNIAIESGGTPNTFTQSDMVIDYIRVYQESTASVLENEKLGNVRVYPNPSQNNITVDFSNNNKKAKGIIYSISGKEVYSFEQNKDSETYDISTLSAGIYVLKLFSEKAFKTVKIIKN